MTNSFRMGNTIRTLCAVAIAAVVLAGSAAMAQGSPQSALEREMVAQNRLLKEVTLNAPERLPILLPPLIKPPTRNPGLETRENKEIAMTPTPAEQMALDENPAFAAFYAVNPVDALGWLRSAMQWAKP